VRVEAKQAASANCFRQDYRAVYTRNGTAPTINGSVVAGTAGGSGLAASATIAVVGNTVLVTLTGVAATTIVWSVTMTVNPVTTAS
jgi:hypothetical protein